MHLFQTTTRRLQRRGHLLIDAPIKRWGGRFDWLACFHFGRLTIREIAHLNGESWLRDYDSISLAISDLAALCGLTIEHRHGRPLKTNQ